VTGDFKEGYFEGGDRHALYVGWVAMLAAMNGLDVAVAVDGDGNYLDRLLITFPPTQGHQEHVLTVVVPPPPEGWTVDD
jgi:hypothetical protein